MTMNREQTLFNIALFPLKSSDVNDMVHLSRALRAAFAGRELVTKESQDAEQITSREFFYVEKESNKRQGGIPVAITYLSQCDFSFESEENYLARVYEWLLNQDVDMVLIALTSNRNIEQMISPEGNMLIKKVTENFPSSPVLLDSNLFSTTELETCCQQISCNRGFLNFPISIPSSVLTVVDMDGNDVEDHGDYDEQKMPPITPIACALDSSKQQPTSSTTCFRSMLLRRETEIQFPYGAFNASDKRISDLLALDQFLFEDGQYELIKQRSSTPEALDQARQELKAAKEVVAKTKPQIANQFTKVAFVSLAMVGSMVSLLLFLGLVATSLEWNV